MFGKEEDIRTAEDMTLGIEKARIKLLSQFMLPFLERTNKFMREMNLSILGDKGLAERFGALFSVIGDKVARIGEAIFK